MSELSSIPTPLGSSDRYGACVLPLFNFASSCMFVATARSMIIILSKRPICFKNSMTFLHQGHPLYTKSLILPDSFLVIIVFVSFSDLMMCGVDRSIMLVMQKSKVFDCIAESFIIIFNCFCTLSCCSFLVNWSKVSAKFRIIFLQIDFCCHCFLSFAFFLN